MGGLMKFYLILIFSNHCLRNTMHILWKRRRTAERVSCKKIPPDRILADHA